MSLGPAVHLRELLTLPSSAVCMNIFEMLLDACQTPVQKPLAGNEINDLLSTHHHRLLLILNK